jgi:hypothetical protein
MRPTSLRCSWGIHKYTEIDVFGRCSCERCDARKPVRFKQIADPDLAGRQLARAKTKGQRKWRRNA